ncbi:hypothetical protein CDL15_Pgr020785 [Punica granatum]|uniref:Uncharacterized protein n=1 Tax=Punica granatum TaxID=22663 RepID=A0A218XWD8_PUNGR|nr:hypothetical protein CDL15_Pgr020785 [Punica granatum]
MEKLKQLLGVTEQEKRKRKLEPCLAYRGQDVPPAVLGVAVPCVWSLDSAFQKLSLEREE